MKTKTNLYLMFVLISVAIIVGILPLTACSSTVTPTAAASPLPVDSAVSPVGETAVSLPVTSSPNAAPEKGTIQPQASTPTSTVYLPVVETPPASPTTGERLQPADLTYLGAFTYPLDDAWAYSGQALAYYPDGDPASSDNHPGSLYASGHVQNRLVGEISIPDPVITSNFDDLPQAAVLRLLADITEGWIDNCTYNDDCIYREVSGLAYLNNVDKVAWNLRDWYNVTDYDQDSLGWSDRDMSGAEGVWHIGDRPSDNDLFHNAKTNDYLFPAPEGFANENMAGRWLIAGNQREAGALGGSQGPTLYALAPWEETPLSSGHNLDALPLLYYPEIIECVWEADGVINENPAPGVCDFPGYRGADHWNGGAWVESGGKSAVLIFGRKGLGDNCYGSTDTCGADPCAIDSGYHAYPYEPQILFYDPAELIGAETPWEVLPYETYRPMAEVFSGECAEPGAVAYDRERGLLYVSEREAGPWGETAVHVWRVASSEW